MAFTKRGMHIVLIKHLYSEVKHKTRSTKSDQKNYRKRIHHRDADIWK